jgi:hypothetical protein
MVIDFNARNRISRIVNQRAGEQSDSARDHDSP